MQRSGRDGLGRASRAESSPLHIWDAQGGATASRSLVSANPVGALRLEQNLILLKYKYLAVQVHPRRTNSGYAP